jgi:hypothetical protein
MERAVRVRFSKCRAGWSYVVLAADSLVWLGDGWSAGSKRECIAMYRKAATESGWVDVDTRQERMKGAA